MKIGLFNYSDNLGGAARATYRIHKSLINEGIDSTLYVSQKTISGNLIKRSPYLSDRIFSNIRPRIASGLMKIFNPNPTSYSSISLLPSKWPKFINSSSLDLVHLNWINAEMMSIEDIAKISKPVVWTFHDMWPFLGSAHLAESAPSHKNIIQKLINIDRWTYNRKKKNWNNLIQIVTPSRWLEDLVKQSELMNDWSVTTIPHPINTEFWQPNLKENAKELLGIDNSKIVILYGADGGTKSLNKGFDLLLQAIEKIENPSKNLLLCIFGESEQTKINTKIPVLNFGRIKDDNKLRLLYCAADVCVVPSRQESFCQVALESQSCGTPVVAFSVGGLNDVIEHGITGYLASPFDINMFSTYLQQCLNEHDNSLTMGVNARQRALKLFSMSSVAKKYINLYEQQIKI